MQRETEVVGWDGSLQSHFDLSRQTWPTAQLLHRIWRKSPAAWFKKVPAIPKKWARRHRRGTLCFFPGKKFSVGQQGEAAQSPGYGGWGGGWFVETWVKFYLASNIIVFLADILFRMDFSSLYSVKLFLDPGPIFVLLKWLTALLPNQKKLNFW